MLIHVVLFRFEDPADATDARERLLAMQGRIPSLRAIEAGADIVRSERSWDLALITRFDDRAGLDAYAAHPVHAEVLAWLRPRATSIAAVDFE